MTLMDKGMATGFLSIFTRALRPFNQSFFITTIATSGTVLTKP